MDHDEAIRKVLLLTCMVTICKNAAAERHMYLDQQGRNLIEILLPFGTRAA